MILNKKTILAVFFLLFFVLTFVIIDIKGVNGKGKNEDTETRAVYISYIEFDSYIKDKDSATSKENIIKMLENAKNMGFNTVIVHVRPFADSIYESEYYPISSTVLNDMGNIPDYDILEFFVTEAHKRELKIEAWVNPFRVSNLTDLSKIPIDSPYYEYVKTNDAKVIDGVGIYLNPASSRVREFIVKGIEEIVENYDVDGIHFDDYFYPDKTIDLESYSEYVEDGGLLPLEEYRLNQVTMLIQDVYESIKKINKEVLFGIAPEGNIENNYEDNYLDVKEIISKSGYVDYIMPQIYFGFENQYKPFMDTLNFWNSLIGTDTIQLIPALAFYKSGLQDSYAGVGINEWIENDDIIKRQVLISRNTNHYGGFSLFRYDYLFNENKSNNNIEKEILNLKEILPT